MAKKQQYAKPLKFFSYISLKIQTPKFEIKQNIDEPTKPNMNKLFKLIFVLTLKKVKVIKNKDPYTKNMCS